MKPTRTRHHNFKQQVHNNDQFRQTHQAQIFLLRNASVHTDKQTPQ